MLSVHFNGEIVRHKDMKAIQVRNQEKNDFENRCKYGCHLLNCQTWVKYCQERPEIKKISEFGGCVLSGSIVCPRYKARVKQGNKKKEFTIDWKTYRKVSSSAHYMLKESEHKAVFITLTFPNWIRKPKSKRAGEPAKHLLTKSFYYDEITNKLFSKFAENLRKNYDCSNYIAVKEYGTRYGRVHFHLIATLPYISFARLNDSWVNTISNYCEYSNHALQTDKKTSCIIRTPNRAVRYVCKYISKSFGVKSGTRIVFISNCTLKKPITIREQNYNHIDLLRGFKSIQIKTYEHVTVFKVMEPKEFNNFCHKFLYPLFECTIKKSEFHYQITEKPG